MDLRDSKSRLILVVAALGAALVIAVASCSGGGDEDGDGSSETSQETENGGADGGDDGENGSSSPEPTGDETPEEILAEVTGEGGVTLTVTRAEREDGGFLTIEGTITNGRGEMWFDTNWAGQEQELAQNGFSMAGASVVAAEEGRRYLILRDTDGRCLCTGFGNGIEAGETVNWFAQFPQPEAETTEVDFQIGQMPPATIEIR